jgi:polyisoprenoid-binding protein YceI
MFNITQICSAFILLLSCQVAAADSWNLPQELNDQNTQVTFAVDSTWHMVHGVTSGLAGKVWLADPKNQASLKAEIRIPVARFNTDNASRDERLREVMAAKEYQEVVLRLNSGPDCSITQGELSECRGELLGSLEIRGVSKDLRLPYLIKKDGEHYLVSGELSLMWGSFGVEDPSILIARVDPEVTIKYQVRL